MTRLFLLALGLIPSFAFANAGYTFIGSIEHALPAKQHVITFVVMGIAFLLIGTIYRAKVWN
jgi:hypothetical protein